MCRTCSFGHIALGRGDQVYIMDGGFRFFRDNTAGVEKNTAAFVLVWLNQAFMN